MATIREQHTVLSITNTEGRTPEWGALHRAWVGYVIAKSQDDYEKMRKYAIVIRKFQRRLNIAISDFPDIGVYGFEEDFENKEEDDDSKLAVYDPWSRERVGEARGDENEDKNDDENKTDEDDDTYRQVYTEDRQLGAGSRRSIIGIKRELRNMVWRRKWIQNKSLFLLQFSIDKHR